MPSFPGAGVTPPVPARHIRAPQVTLWHDADYLVQAADRRADWTRNALRFAWQLIRRSTREMLTAPKKGATWRHLATDLGLSQRTIGALYAWFIDAGLLARAVPGTTVRYRKGTRGGLDDDGRGNEAAQYLLIIPEAILEAEDGEETPPPSATVESQADFPWPCVTGLTRPLPEAVPDVSSAHDPVERSFIPKPPLSSVGEETPRTARARQLAAPATPASLWPATVTPVSRRDRLAACERLIAELPPFRKISARHLRSVLRDVFDLGATISDIRHALDHRPDGTAWINTHRPRSLPGWVRHRLTAWITPAGRLVAPWPVQRRAAEHAALLAEQRARREAGKRASQNNRLDGPMSFSGRW
ncbi:hypothetical protein BKM31_15810 [[Actinomadura] parvosata subsp. kistnae]|uniref:Uncharacterized protein n=1 Tax=[Actinomadura] parvosata subsp. kistnae TaxID=1909395 RepID=A0A1U9ZXR7_9ACTN|nr:hypothetical protein [Nonomuraea sp. ATCC 55076]AQZ62727.1 hypothetical protein BKM31_15810 [Nonomuraea sp. ATCC 55076]